MLWPHKYTRVQQKAVCKFFGIFNTYWVVEIWPHTLFPSRFLGLSDRRNLRYNLWSWKYLLHKTSRINLVGINCVPFLIFHSRGVIFFSSRIEFRAALCLRLELSARPNPVLLGPVVLFTREITVAMPNVQKTCTVWSCRAFKKYLW